MSIPSAGRLGGCLELRVLSAEKRLESHLADRIGVTVFKDDPRFNLYSLSDGDVVKAHKVVRVQKC